MEAFGIIGMTFGAAGFIFSLLALVQMERHQKQIAYLESELEKLKAE